MGGPGGAPRFDPEAFAEDWARRHRWRLYVPGQHHSGLSNQALLEVRRREGRDYDRRTRAQTEHLIERLAEAFGGYRKAPASDSVVRQKAGSALKEWVLMRHERGGFDAPFRALTPAYARKKAAAGKGGKPIGEWSGRWIGAVKSRGHFEFE